MFDMLFCKCQDNSRNPKTNVPSAKIQVQKPPVFLERLSPCGGKKDCKTKNKREVSERSL